MKLLSLLRHAKAGSPDPNLADIEKPLTTIGENQAAEMGLLLHKEGIIPDWVLCSSALRAISTCRLILKPMELPDNILQAEENLYNADSDTLFESVKTFKSDINVNHLMLCGHNPGMTDFCNRLLKEGSVSMHTCELALLSLNIDDWSEIEWESASLEKYINL